MSPPSEMIKLRSADNIYAFVGKFQGIPSEKDAAVSYFKDMPNLVDWELSLDLFWQWKGFGFKNLCKNQEPLERIGSSEGNELDHSSLSFRVSCDRACVRIKKHGFTSMEAAAALGEGVQKRFGWPADMCYYNLEIMAWIRDGEAIVALALLYSGKKEIDRTSLHFQESNEKESSLWKEEPLEKMKKPSRPSRADSQLYSWRRYRKALVGTSLKPSIAFSLLQLGCILPGNIVLDPMCGCGTIPLEAADWLGNEVLCLAGDIALQAVDATSENLNETGASGQSDLLRWDATNLPFRNGVVDRIICDMPFGVRCGTYRFREWLCPKVVKEVVRVLQLGTGVAVLLGQSKAVRHEIEMKQKIFLEVIQHLPIEMQGLRVEIIVVRRTTEPYTLHQ